MHFVTNTLVTYLDEQFDRKVCEADHAHRAGHRHLWKCCHFWTQIYINCAIIHLNSNISNQLTKHPGARKQLTRVTDCETARLWLCHLHFWGNFDSLSSSEAAANITLSSWLLTRTSETAANMTARSRASAQVHIITELSNLTIHKIHKISSVQDVTSLTHLFPLTTVTGGWVV